MAVVSAVQTAMQRRRLWFAALGVIILAAVGAYQWSTRRPPLNVILVTFDTTRADRLGVYGYEHGLTEAFDDFAKKGVVFERAYAPAPITLPSHASMLTGLYPPEHDLRMNGSGKLAKEIPSLPQILKEHDYDTGAFIAAPAVLGAKFGLNRGFDTYNDDFPQTPGRPGHHGEPRRDGKEVVDLALKWMQQRTDRPFFCWIHLYDAHAPYDPRVDVYDQKFVENPYDAGVTWQLEQFERVTNYLKDRKLDSNTLVVVAGDHGEGLDEHQEDEHGMLVYNTTMHVPFVFAGPPECQPGTRVATTVSLVDLAPTVLDMLHISGLEKSSGRSLLNALKGETIEERHCYGEAETPYVLNHWSPLRTIISDRWKFILSTRSELYDLDQDPGELTNLFDSASDESQRMEELLTDMQSAFTYATASSANLSDKDLANLQSLGYVSGGTSTRNQSAADAETELVDVKDMLPLLAKFEKAKHKGLEGSLEESIVLLQEIVQATDKFPAAEVLLGDCFAQTGRLKDAENIYRSLLARQPDFDRVHLTLGRVLAGQGEFNAAEEEYRAFLQTTPDAASAHFELGQLLIQQQKFDEAADAYRQTLRLAPDLVDANIALGQLLAMQRRPMESIACFEAVLQHDANNPAAHANLSIMYAQTAQPGKAIQHGTRAVELLPDSFEMRFNLGVMLLSQKRTVEGIQQLRVAQKLRPDDPRPVQHIDSAEAAMRK